MTPEIKVSLLTAGKDRHYVIGLLEAFRQKPVRVDCIAGDEVEESDAVKSDQVDFYNIVGSQDAGRPAAERVLAVIAYYGRLLVYAARTDATILHVLWFRKFVRLERVLLTAYFRLLGKRLVFTAHNVDGEARDGKSTMTNRLSLRFLYRSVNHILVHTGRMKDELIQEFGVRSEKVTVVPFGINNVIPESKLTPAEAKRRLGFEDDDRVLLFFGTIVPYKGVEDLLSALAELTRRGERLKLVIGGPVWTESRTYWQQLQRKIDDLNLKEHIRQEVRSTYLPDDDVAVFFRAADVSILPYRRIYQSGVLALSYRQGVPVIAAAVGSMMEDVLVGTTGLLFRAGDVTELADRISFYFGSELYSKLEGRRPMIRAYGEERFSWSRNVDSTFEVYRRISGVSEEHRGQPVAPDEY